MVDKSSRLQQSVDDRSTTSPTPSGGPHDHRRPPPASLTGTYSLDPTHSRIGFVARHAMVTKVRGSFNDFEGTAVLDGDDPSRSTASVTIQAASIDTRQAQRDEHLRSNDFLAMDEFPTITFVSPRSAAARRRRSS